MFVASQPTILTQVANFVAGLQTAVGSLLATLTAAKQSCLAVELSRLHLTDTLLQVSSGVLARGRQRCTHSPSRFRTGVISKAPIVRLCRQLICCIIIEIPLLFLRQVVFINAVCRDFSAIKLAQTYCIFG